MFRFFLFSSLLIFLLSFALSSSAADIDNIIYLPVITAPCETYCDFEFLWPEELQGGDMQDYLVNYRETFLVCWHAEKFCQLMYAEELVDGDPVPIFP